MALTDKLTAIADATRAKTGTTNQMTLDEIATAINGISIEKGIGVVGIPMPTKTSSLFTIKHSIYSQYVDTNFPFFLVFGFYITGFNKLFCKIVKVDMNKLTIEEKTEIGDTATLHYSINETQIAIATNSNMSMTFSLTSTPGYIYLFGTNK